MKPPRSIVFFTTVAGAGYGMLVLLPWFPGHGAKVALTALALISIGLLSSAAHLVNPKNAWRAVRCFRTSWLSREAVFALAVYPPAALVTARLPGHAPAPLALTWISALLSLATLYCTGMIYQSLRTIPLWHTPFTALRFVSHGLASGALLYGWLAAPASHGLTMTTLMLLLLSLFNHAAATAWQNRQAKARLNQALGVDQRRARLLDAGHSASTFLTREFGYDTPTLLRQGMRTAELLLAYALPTLLLGALPAASPWIAPTAGILGIALGRWLFFAQAQHVVRLYHGQNMR